MHRVVRNLALAGVLLLGGVAAGCQPEQKECHCSGPNCSCPLPPAPKPAASDGETDQNAGPQIAASGAAAHRQMHVAHHAASRAHRAMAARHRHGHLAARAHERVGGAARFASNHRTGREASRALPYDYRSGSHHYASTQEWAYAERHRARRAVRQSEYDNRYSERDTEPQPLPETYSEESGRAESYDGGEYDGAGELEGPPPSYSGGAAGHWTMSINAPEALDSWHGYGIDCPDLAW